MQLERTEFDEAVVIKVAEPRIDAAVAILFKDKVRDLAETGAVRVVLDMEQVEFLDSSGLGALVAVMKQLGSDRKLELVALSPAVEKVFRLTRMDTVFLIHKSMDDVLVDLKTAS